MAASVPLAASGGGYVLGAVAIPSATSKAIQETPRGVQEETISQDVEEPAIITTTNTVDHVAAMPDPTPSQVIEETPASTSVADAAPTQQAEVSPAPSAETFVAKAAEYGGSAIAALGAIVGSAAVAVEKATGIDLTHSDQPVSMIPG